MRKRRGLALILVVGVLGILAVLGVSFAVLSRLERRSALLRVHGTRAVLLARSGVEDALARLNLGQEPEYGGEDWNDDAALSGPEPAGEVFQAGTLNTYDCPVRFAMRPSYFAADSLQQPLLVQVDGRSRGYSGRFGSGRTCWTLRVDDDSGKINVNGGFLDDGDRDDTTLPPDGIPDGDAIPDHRDSVIGSMPTFGYWPTDRIGWNYDLTCILDALGQAIDYDGTGGAPGLGAPDMGDKILAARPKGGYRTIREVERAAGATVELTPYLTLSSWIDRRALSSNQREQSASQGTNPANPILRDLVGIKKNRRPLRWEERPPVNLNRAPKPVLWALLSPYRFDVSPPINGLSGMSYANEDWRDWAGNISFAQGQAIADAILSRRSGPQGPFRDWSDFHAFADALHLLGALTVPAPLKAWGIAAQQDLIKAIFNPNANLNKQYPDPLIWKWIDKTDVLYGATEGILHPTGAYRVSSVGRVLSPDGRVLSERGISATPEIFRLLRHTTQSDFVGERTRLADYLSLNTDLGKTTGASAGILFWGGAPATAGVALMTYPNPPNALKAKRAFEFDGMIGLATREIDSAGPGALSFVHHFDDSLNADVGSSTARQPNGQNVQVQSDLTRGVWPGWLDGDADGILDTPEEPCNVYPDGYHLMSDRGLAFLAQGNLPSLPAVNYGVLSYWIKAMPKLDNMFGDDQYVRAGMPGPPMRKWQRFSDFCCIRATGPTTDQVLMVGRGDQTLGDTWGMVVDRLSGSGSGKERQSAIRHAPVNCGILPGLRWRLVTARFNTTAGLTAANAARLIVKGFPALPNAFNNGTGTAAFATTPVTENLDQPGVQFVLGRIQIPQFSGGNPDYFEADGVMDEFAICDFGSTTAVNAAIDTWATTRFQEGRYYKGNDGCFLSVPISPNLGREFRVVRSWWTATLPSENRLEFSVKWTGTVTADQVPDLPVPRIQDPLLARADVRIDLLDQGGTLTTPPSLYVAQGGREAYRTNGFRYRVNLRPFGGDDPSLHVSDPVLETPFLEDVTFGWAPVSGTWISSWEE